MVWTVIQIATRRLMHSRLELLLTFAVPAAFFSIFALIFGTGVGSGATPRVRVAAVDQVQSAASERVWSRLEESPGLRFHNRPEGTVGLTRDEAQQLVQRGVITAAIVLTGNAEGPAAELLVDTSDMVAPPIVEALVLRALGEAWAAGSNAGPFNPPRQTESVRGVDRSNASTVRRAVAGPQDIDTAFAVRQTAGGPADESYRSSGELLGIAPGRITGSPAASAVPAISATLTDQRPVAPSVTIVDTLGHGKANPVIAMYAAGIAVMFLLFSASGGGGALLDEQQNQTLDRLLASRMTMDQLLLGKWLYLTLLGCLQTTIMFVWGQLAFGLELLQHWDGFAVMTMITAGAAASFGLLLATASRTRGQLNSLSVVTILTMSALGGSMVPRYLMSDSLQQFGRWTFNAWALDGYNKVFWREASLASLWPELAVLTACGFVFLIAARVLAVRWEHS
jgi:ABC-2 type transport system permease protein